MGWGVETEVVRDGMIYGVSNFYFAVTSVQIGKSDVQAENVLKKCFVRVV